MLNAQATVGSADSAFSREAWDISRLSESWTTAGGSEVDVLPFIIRSAYVYGRVAGDTEALREVVQLAGPVHREIAARANGLLGLLIGDLEIIEKAIVDLQQMPREHGGPGLLPKLAQHLAGLIAEDNPSKALDLLKVADEALGQGHLANDPLTMWLTAKHRFQAWKIGGDIDGLHPLLH